MSVEKVKDKPKVEVTERPRESYRPKDDEDSLFRKILESNRLQQKSAVQPQNEMEKLKMDGKVIRREEQGERGRDRKDDEKERDVGKERAKEERKSTSVEGKKIMGKGQKQDGEGGSSQFGGREGGFGRPLYKKINVTEKKGAHAKGIEASLENSKFATRLKGQIQTAHLSKEFIQKMVGQMVRFLKSGINKDGDHEIRLDLSERIFKGLRLRVALKDGKVSVDFHSSDSKVRELFKNSSSEIKGELEARGISVREIKVT